MHPPVAPRRYRLHPDVEQQDAALRAQDLSPAESAVLPPSWLGAPLAQTTAGPCRQGSQCFYIRDVYDVLTIYVSPMVNWTVQGHCSIRGYESGSRHRSSRKRVRRWEPKFRFVPIR